MIRRLTTLAEGFYNPGKWYVSFAYYEQDKFDRLEWTGDSEGCEFTEDELYQMVKPKLKAEHTELKRNRRQNERTNNQNGPKRFGESPQGTRHNKRE